MKLYIILILALVTTIPIFAADITLTKNGWGAYDAAQYNLNDEQNTAVNEARANADLLRLNQLYHLTDINMVLADETDGTPVEVGTAANGQAEVKVWTIECVIGGVKKWHGISEEVFEWKTETNLTADKACVYLFSFDGASTSTAASYTITKGDEVASTEVAVYPACPTGEAPFMALKIRTDTLFDPGTTNFNASGVTTTLETLIGMPSGASSPAASAVSDVDMTVDRY